MYIPARLNISYPMLFKLTNDRNSLHTHCGVLEFSAEEGRVYVPRWVSYPSVCMLKMMCVCIKMS